MTQLKTQIQKKVCLLGDFGVGKSSLINRFVYNRFEGTYLSTIGVRISRKEVTWQNLSVHLLIWDLAGGEEFAEMLASYLQGASGALLVCDLTRSNTLSVIEHYGSMMRSSMPSVSFIILGNKSDLAHQSEIKSDNLEQLSQQLQAPWWFTSAKTGENVEIAFKTLAERLMPGYKR